MSNLEQISVCRHGWLGEFADEISVDLKMTS